MSNAFPPSRQAPAIPKHAHAPRPSAFPKFTAQQHQLAAMIHDAKQSHAIPDGVNASSAPGRSNRCHNAFEPAAQQELAAAETAQSLAVEHPRLTVLSSVQTDLNVSPHSARWLANIAARTNAVIKAIQDVGDLVLSAYAENKSLRVHMCYGSEWYTTTCHCSGDTIHIHEWLWPRVQAHLRSSYCVDVNLRSPNDSLLPGSKNNITCMPCDMPSFLEQTNK